jgi:hypothetical protein
MDVKKGVTRVSLARLSRGSALVAGLLLASAGAQATTIDLSLGASTQDWIATGIGPSSGTTGTYANWSMTQGACTGTSAITCTLSGSYAAQGTIAAGTYSFVTTYTSTPSNSAPTGISEVGNESSTPADENYFYYTSFPANTNMVLTLDPTGGTPLVEDLVTSSTIENSTFFFLYNALVTTPVCTGIGTACSPYNVGVVPGATYTDPVTIGVTITEPAAPVPVPGTWAMMLSGLLLLAGFKVFRLKRSLTGAMPMAA